MGESHPTMLIPLVAFLPLVVANLRAEPRAEPSQPANTHRTWTQAHALAHAFVANLTLVQKVDITTGLGWEIGRCEGNIGPQPDIGWPGLCLQDGPVGVRFADHVSAFPAGINAAAT
jgi:beta-glucosidase